MNQESSNARTDRTRHAAHVALLCVGLGLILIAISEMIGAKTGIGFMIWDAWQVLSVETMYVGLVVIAIIGFLLTLILNEVESWLLPWRRER